MARYIKANPKVAQFLNLQNDRNTVKDGNYILWQNDLLAFGPLTRLSETLAAIGAIALMPHEAREEQDGVKLRPLPTATDPRFEVPAPVETTEPETPAAPAEGENPDGTEGDASGENPDDNAQQPGNGAEPTEGDNPGEAEGQADETTTNKTTKKATV